ncbi:unnamed protein product, partial [Amoebophrya sp. A25]|eukprot:GSA25T00017112001.1
MDRLTSLTRRTRGRPIQSWVTTSISALPLFLHNYFNSYNLLLSTTLSSTSLVGAVVEEISFPSDGVDDYWTLLMYDIGLRPGATVDIDLTNVVHPDAEKTSGADAETSSSGTSSQDDDHGIVFFSQIGQQEDVAGDEDDTGGALSDLTDVNVLLVTHEQWVNWNEGQPFSLPEGELNTYFQSTWRSGPFSATGSMQATFTLPKTAGKNSKLLTQRYHLGVINPWRKDLFLHGRVEMTNPGSEHLSVQQENVAAVYAASSLVNLCTALFVFLLYISIWRLHTNATPRPAFPGQDPVPRPFATGVTRSPLHLAMCSVFVLKSFFCSLQLQKLRQLEATGTLEGWRGLLEFLPQLAEKTETIISLELMLVLALGYRVLRSRLNMTEIRLLAVMGSVSLYLAVFEITCVSASSCSGYKLARDLLHSLGFLVIVVAMNFNLHTLGMQIEEASAGPEVAKLYARHSTYWHFRWIFLFFITAPTILVFLQLSVLDWESHWIFVAVKELFSWLLVVSLVYVFQPGFAVPKLLSVPPPGAFRH